MRTFLRPVALTVALLFAAVPAAALACQWVCAMPVPSAPTSEAAAAESHHAGHGSPAHADVAAVPARGTAAIQAVGSACEHTGMAEPAVTRASVKGLVSIFIPATDAVVAPPPDLRRLSDAYATHSPPGGRSAPLPLRI